MINKDSRPIVSSAIQISCGDCDYELCVDLPQPYYHSFHSIMCTYCICAYVVYDIYYVFNLL